MLRRHWREIAAYFFMFLAAVMLLIFAAVGTKAQPTAILPTITSTTNVTTGTAVQIVGVNPTRRMIQICPFTASVNVAPVNPAGMTAVTPTATVGVPIAAGACFTPPFGLQSSGTAGGMGAAWQAIGVSGTATVNVLEY